MVRENFGSAAYTHEAESIGRPPHDCKVKGHITAIDSTTNMSYSIRIESEYYEDVENLRYLNYRLNDFGNSFKLYPLLEMQNVIGNQSMHRDSIKSQLTLGGKTYENVIIQTRNMDSISGINFKVNKVYLAAGHGIIGFVDKEGSLYHR